MNLQKVLCLTGATLLAASVTAMPLPDPAPAFEAKSIMKAAPVLRKEFAGTVAKAVYEAGNKQVVLYDNDRQKGKIFIYVNGKECGDVMFWGSNKKGSGFPFKDIPGETATLNIDEKSGVTTFQKAYLKDDGSKADFILTVKIGKDGKLEFSCKGEAAPWFILPVSSEMRTKKITINEKELVKSPRQDILDKKVKWLYFEKTGNIVYNADDPLNAYSVEFGDNKGHWNEELHVPKIGDDRYTGIHRLGTRTDFKIDFGQIAFSDKKTPPPVGGIDFWKHDATHVPALPVRNKMPNPSFEQGLRYWAYGTGGATYVPSAVPRHEVVDKGLFGKKALLIRPVQTGSIYLRTMPFALEKGKKYVYSFYLKKDNPNEDGSIAIWISSVARHGKIPWMTPAGSTYRPENEWKRYSRTFEYDGAGIHLNIGGKGNVLIDGIQIEPGTEPTEFVSVPVEACFTTSNPDNDIVKGNKIDAGFAFSGKPDATGTAEITIEDAYRETLWKGKLNFRLGKDGTQNLKLPLNEKIFDEGIFLVRIQYTVPGTVPYFEYYRFSIMKPLDNLHPTKNLIGTGFHAAIVARGDDLARKYMEWGFGSTSWESPDRFLNNSASAQFREKYRVQNMHWSIREKIFLKFFPGVKGRSAQHAEFRKIEKVTPEMEKIAEEETYLFLKDVPPECLLYVSWGNEEESHPMLQKGKFDEYFKLQAAVARGAKRANPNFKSAPTSGTSGYSLLRGYEAIEGYLAASKRNGFKYDAVAVHPYGNIDKGILSMNDMDEETARLIAQMEKYGYGKETPILYTEGFNSTETNIPEWRAGICYDDYQGGKATYDLGNREFIHAASAARQWIICMKYWPQVQSTNIWVYRPFLDVYLTPILLCKAANTLGTHFPYVEYLADIKPYAGIRGYAFKLKDGSGAAALWCVNHDVENGLKRGPKIQVKFDQPVEFYDLMGARRTATPGKDGYTEIPLTAAPLIFKAKDAARLSEALRKCISSDTSSNLAVSMRPETKGGIEAKVKNLTGMEQTGKLEVAGKEFTYRIAPDAEQIIPLPGSTKKIDFGKMYRFERKFDIIPSEGKKASSEWKMDYFFVKKTNGAPDWNKIPSIPISNHHSEVRNITKDDFSAKYQMAWDNRNLYLRVEVADDHFMSPVETWKIPGVEKRLWSFDGCLEVYFDCGANGRTNLFQEYDNDDYRYDFAVGKSGGSGPGTVYRYKEVYHQLADGINMPSKEEASKNIKCDFQRTATGYVYTITFALRYIEPIALRNGFVSGFALYIHDKDPSKTEKGLTTGTRTGEHCQHRPATWPLMIFVD